LRADELRERAWELVEPYFQQETEAVIGAYRQVAGTGQAINDIREVAAAAQHGRVGTLLVAVDAQVRGTVDPESGAVQVEDNASEDAGSNGQVLLTDFAATQTLLNGGTVFALPQSELPTESPVAALLRY
jgi:hypothetical protein